jgi:predicted nucleic acid-binding protein
MKRILTDTNIVIDLLAKREPFYKDAAKLFSLADKRKVRLFVSALTFANVNYVLLKQRKPEETKQILRRLKLIVGILDLEEKAINLALNDNDFNDFEDALQYFSAIENNIEIIVTRNLKDFRNSKLPVMTAEQCIKSLK